MSEGRRPAAREPSLLTLAEKPPEPTGSRKAADEIDRAWLGGSMLVTPSSAEQVQRQRDQALSLVGGGGDVDANRVPVARQSRPHQQG
jgi:hypothetical protein